HSRSNDEQYHYADDAPHVYIRHSHSPPLCWFTIWRESVPRKSNPDERTTASDTDWYVSKEV
ncbi:unnamed protein product, partial [marine sediment metagenome]